MATLGIANRTITDLPLAACHLIDLPENGIDCSVLDENQCIRCPILGQFISGEGMDDYGGSGHITCFILGFITFIIGTWGTFANILIILILKKQNSGRSFDTFLIGLASFDLLCSVTSVMAGTSAVAYYQNWNRGIPTLVAWYIGTLTMLWSRSGSSFMTVLITLERFMVVAYPSTATDWFTAKRTKNLAIAVLIFSFMMAFPRYTSFYIGKNTIGKHIERTRDLDHIYLSTSLDKFWYHDAMGFFDQIDFWVPLPLLLLFNVLMYYHIRKFTARRKVLNLKHQKDIRAAKMFVPVVIVLFLCNVEPIIHYFFIFSGVVYRETSQGILVSFTVNAAVNLPIYYFRGSTFRREARALLSSCCLTLTGRRTETQDNGKGTGTTSGSRSVNENKGEP